MQEKPASRPWWFALAFISIAVVARAASGEDDSPTGPHGVDLVFYGGNANAVALQVLNLSPYDITFLDADLRDNTDLDRDKCNNKKMMFAPVGMPATLPGVPADALNSSSYKNTTTHPYNAVVSWSDCGDAHPGGTYSINWRVNNVKYESGTGNVKVQVSFTRNEPKNSLMAGYFFVMKDFVGLGLKAAGLVAEPMNPLAWIEAFTASAETINGVNEFNKENTQQDYGDKMWVAAYVWPEEGKCRGTVTPNCMPSKAASDDAVDTQWGSGMAGFAQAEIVVTTQILRGSSFTKGSQGNYRTYGTLPIVEVTIWDANTYLSSNGTAPKTLFAATQNGKKVQSLLHQRGRAGVIAFRNLIKSMDHEQRQTLAKAFRNLHAKRPLGEPEKQVLADLTSAFEKNAKTMNQETPQRGGQSHVR